MAAHIDPGARLVLFRCSGELALSEVRRAFNEMIDDPGFEPGINALWDLRAAAEGVRAHEIPDLLGIICSRQEAQAGGRKVALLVGGASDSKLPDLFENGANRMPIDVKVFRSYAQATAWLGGNDL